MNRIDLKGRNAVVTGGASGIGYAIAQRLIASGATLSLWDLDAKGLKTAAKSLAVDGIQPHCAVADVTDPAAVEAAAKAGIARLGSIDILVNNAGIAGADKKNWEYTLEEWNRVLAIDLTGVFLCCRAVVPSMLARALSDHTDPFDRYFASAG